jgi:DNA (cytosine-5)-methyltransferase 1
LRFLSLFSGIEAASCAWSPLGWECVGVCEIEPFPSKVLAYHYGCGPAERLPEPGPEPVKFLSDADDEPTPEWEEWAARKARIRAHAAIHPCTGVRNLGDVMAVDFLERAAELLPDVLVGGSPCQSFSVAGMRASLGDPRGNLALRFAQTVEAVDAARRVAGLPGVIVLYENVPGLLSTKDNAFGCLLGALAGCATPVSPYQRLRWTNAGLVSGPIRRVAWRVLDAQFFGLAQRRKRVFVVASPRDGADPAQILFERAGLRGDPAPSRETGQEVAGPLRAKSSGGYRNDLDSSGAFIPTISPALKARDYKGPSSDGDGDGAPLIAHALRAEGFDASEAGPGRGTPLVCGTLNANAKAAGSATQQDAEAGLLIPVAFSVKGTGHPSASLPIGHDQTPTLESKSGNMAVLAFDTTQITHPENRCHPLPGEPCHPLPGEPCHPLAAGAHVPAIAFQHRATPSQSMNPSEVVPTLGAVNAEGMSTLNRRGVRRLVPAECEALQGFPRGYTAIPDASDGPRYRALGNSMAVPVIAWIGMRIEIEVALFSVGLLDDGLFDSVFSNHEGVSDMAAESAKKPKKITSHLKTPLQIAKASPIGVQRDMFGGPDKAIYLETGGAERIKAHRLELKISTVACARAVGISKEEWKHLEDGSSFLVTPRDIEKVMAALRIEADRLLTAGKV